MRGGSDVQLNPYRRLNANEQTTKVKHVRAGERGALVSRVATPVVEFTIRWVQAPEESVTPDFPVSLPMVLGVSNLAANVQIRINPVNCTVEERRDGPIIRSKRFQAGGNLGV